MLIQSHYPHNIAQTDSTNKAGNRHYNYNSIDYINHILRKLRNGDNELNKMPSCQDLHLPIISNVYLWHNSWENVRLVLLVVLPCIEFLIPKTAIVFKYSLPFILLWCNLTASHQANVGAAVCHLKYCLQHSNVNYSVQVRITKTRNYRSISHVG